MKNLVFSFLTVFTLVLTTSCSKDDDGNPAPAASEVRVNIDGEDYTFNSVIVDQDTYVEGGVTYTDYDVTATIDNGTERIINFEVEQGDTGSDAIYFFTYTLNGTTYDSFSGSTNFSAVVSVSNETTITASFSGDLGTWNNETQQYDTITLSNGTITANF